jgi:hypothetical protein
MMTIREFILHEVYITILTMSIITGILLLLDQPIFPLFWYGLYGVGAHVVFEAFRVWGKKKNDGN